MASVEVTIDRDKSILKTRSSQTMNTLPWSADSASLRAARSVKSQNTGPLIKVLAAAGSGAEGHQLTTTGSLEN